MQVILRQVPFFCAMVPLFCCLMPLNNPIPKSLYNIYPNRHDRSQNIYDWNQYFTNASLVILIFIAVLRVRLLFPFDLLFSELFLARIFFLISSQLGLSQWKSKLEMGQRLDHTDIHTQISYYLCQNTQIIYRNIYIYNTDTRFYNTL